MLPEIEGLFEALELRKASLLRTLQTVTEEQLRCRPAPDRWSILMTLEHVVMGERGIRLTEIELKDHPLIDRLEPGKMFDVVMGILEKDIAVDVPHPSLEPTGATDFGSLQRLWNAERSALANTLEGVSEGSAARVKFSHPAAGPLDAARTLRLAIAHFDTHRRQIDRIRQELA